jgi:hypothetical protein
MRIKIRTIILSLLAAGGFAAASIAPAVSHADSKSKGKEVTCDGAQPGDILETTVTVKKNGKEVVSITRRQICGSDGKWHDVVSLEISKGPNGLGAKVVRESVVVSPSGAVKTVTRVIGPAYVRLGASAPTPVLTSASQVRGVLGRPDAGSYQLP